MTSAINYNNIDEFYPIAGQDNNSQGFRDNFANIKTALSTANSEVSDLQNKAILSATLGENATTIVNDLNGSVISNGKYKQFNGVVYANTISANAPFTVDCNNGPLHEFTLSYGGGSATINFTNWPIDPSDACATIRLHLKSGDASAYTITLAGAEIVLESAFPSPLTVPSNGQNIVVEAWSFSPISRKVFVRYLGLY